MIVSKIINKIKYMHNKKKYGSFGSGSIVKKEFRILNKKNIEIGSNVVVFDNARIEAITSWYEENFEPKIIIGSNTSFQQNLHMICANKVEIGSNCVFSANVFISDLNHEYQNVEKSVMEQNLIVDEVTIGDTCFVGYGACILPGAHLGKHCVVGANAVVTKSFPDYTVVVGNPAKAIKRFDSESSLWKKTDSFGNFI